MIGGEVIRQDIAESVRLIEKLRQRLESLAVSRGSIDDNDVLAASQELDAAINYYFSNYRSPETKRQGIDRGITSIERSDQ